MSSEIGEVESYTFPALRGIQSGREYYMTMCPLKLISRIFIFDSEEIPPKLRAQRTLNKARIPEITRYLVDNPKDYTFSAITASIDGPVKFEPYSSSGKGLKMGNLIVPMTARFLINDGQHRRAAVEEALKMKPELGMETISVVFFIDAGLKRSQQMFADLNKHAIRPTKSIGILYDHRDPLARSVMNIIDNVTIFKNRTELEKTTISNRSLKLFTLSSIYQATKELLGKRGKKNVVSNEEEQLVIDYWSEVSKNMIEWQLLLQDKTTSSELRKEYMHVHGLILHALGIAGNLLISKYPREWKNRLKNLKEVDWSKSNVDVWEGRATVGGRVSKAQINVDLTTNYIKRKLGLKLDSREKITEKKFLKRRNR